MKITKAEYDAIKARASVPHARIGQLRPAVICVDVMGQAANPDDFTPEIAAEFKARAEALALSIQDRKTLINFIDEHFDVQWPD